MRKNYFLTFILFIVTLCVQASIGGKSELPTGVSNPSLTLVNAPTGFNGFAVAGSSTELRLVWNDNSIDETAFEIAYAINPSGPTIYHIVRTNGPNYLSTGEFILPNLAPNTQYHIWIRAIREGGTIENPICYNPDVPANSNPAGISFSCWDNLLVRSTNPSLPLIPTDCVVAPISQRTVTVNWMDNATNEGNFEIYRSTEGGPFEFVSFVPANPGTGMTSFVDTGLNANYNYAYKVYAANVTGQVGPAVSSRFNTLPDPPPAPIALNVSNIGLNNIALGWINHPAEETAVIVEASNDNMNWIEVASLSPYMNLLDNTGLPEATTYYFRVKAINTGGPSPYSNTVSATTLKRVVPNPSYELTAKAASPTTVKLSWVLGVEDNVTNNRIAQGVYRSTVSATAGFVQIATLDNVVYTYEDNNCSPKTKYWYRVSADNYQGSSEYSNVATVTTLGPPSAPSDLEGIVTKDALQNSIIKVMWKDNSDDESKFTLQRALDEKFTSQVLTSVLDSNNTSAVSIPIEEGITYYFRIKASNKYGESAYSPTSMMQTAYSTVPNPPYELRASVKDGKIMLNWADGSNSESSFEIERSTDSTMFTKIASADRNMMNYTDISAVSNTKYYYRVRAINTVGNSEYTNIAEAKIVPATTAVVNTDDAMQVFPNPTADLVTVKVPENMIQEGGYISIANRTNQEVKRILLKADQKEYKIDLNNYAEGTYTISIKTKTQQITKRAYKL